MYAKQITLATPAIISASNARNPRCSFAPSGQWYASLLRQTAGQIRASRSNKVNTMVSSHTFRAHPANGRGTAASAPRVRVTHRGVKTLALCCATDRAQDPRATFCSVPLTGWPHAAGASSAVSPDGRAFAYTGSCVLCTRLHKVDVKARRRSALTQTAVYLTLLAHLQEHTFRKKGSQSHRSKGFPMTAGLPA